MISPEPKSPEKLAAVVYHQPRLSRFFLRPRTPDAPFFTRVRWGSVATTVVALTLAGYVSLATAAFLFLRYHHDLAALAWLDVALPSRWPRYREARGNHEVAIAQEKFRAGRLPEALIYARAGLARAPANREGRLLVAQVLMIARRPDAARDAMLDGLPFHRADPKFLTPLFGLLLQRQEDDRTIALARDFLQHGPGGEPTRIACLAGATAAWLRGNYDQAEDFLRGAPGLAEARDGRLVAAKIDAERGYRDLALVELRALAADFPNDLEAHTELVARLRQAGLRDEARRLSLSFQFAHPAEAAPRIELLHAYRDDGDAARVAREVEALTQDFATNAPALLALADFAANTGDVALARRLVEHARQHKLPWEPHAFLVIEATVVKRDFRSALDTINRLTAENSDWRERYPGLIDSLQALSYLGVGDAEASRLLLASFLHQPLLRAENLVALANRFAALGADEPARQILARAIDVDPLNQAALTRLVEFDLNLNRIDELPAHLQRLVAMRRPSPDILRVAQHKLGSDLFLFSRERAPALDAVRVALKENSAARR